MIEAAAVAAAVAAAAADPAVAVNPLRESTFVSVKCSIDSLPRKDSHLSPGETASETIGAVTKKCRHREFRVNTAVARSHVRTGSDGATTKLFLLSSEAERETN